MSKGLFDLRARAGEAKKRVPVLDKVRASWTTPPDWLLGLAMACDQSSLRTIAARLSVSPTLISLVANNKYHAPTDHLETQVRTILLPHGDVYCPVLGTITAEHCHLEQGMPFISSNPLRVKLYRACLGCANAQKNTP
ncbi:hypothetical protein [Desulfovibrio psychrotolerans]|uniref:Transcriptional regulator n=1 Tax=Desulfovibrio psychrotolerans TaxID=415242 RepID=A0A7J0BXR4_9BACT|nr:hypothetical protein [Desulfovibrio psychrotolerans]GFM37971.1 hypothetical protein DSM19430T_26550 [Desulfovibrio psychrotolerans]